MFNLLNTLPIYDTVNDNQTEYSDQALEFAILDALDNNYLLSFSQSQELFNKYYKVLSEVISILKIQQKCDKVVTYESQSLLFQFQSIGNHAGSMYAFRFDNSIKPWILFEYHNPNFVSSYRGLLNFFKFSERERSRRKKKERQEDEPLLSYYLSITTINNDYEDYQLCMWVTKIKLHIPR